MSTPHGCTPVTEITSRIERCRTLLEQLHPDAGGLLVSNRLNIYYLSGSFGNGLFWLPKNGTPLLLQRKAPERAALESPYTVTVPFHSYSQLPAIFAEHGATPTSIAVEKKSLTWSLGELLASKLPGTLLISGDSVVQHARAIKSKWEQEKLAIAGKNHATSMCQLLPKAIKPGMTEQKIAHILWGIFFSLGHSGILRTSTVGEELFLGSVSVGTNGYYPSYFDGPLGVMGSSPAVPHMGSAHTVWQKKTLLSVDTGFSFEGYTSDKTQQYFSGPSSSLPSEVTEAHEVCRSIEYSVAKACRPGARLSDLYQLSLDLARQSGFAEGFMGTGGNKVNFIGHSIGLAIDEWPVMAKKFDQTVQAGMVFAIEPKITLPGHGMVGTENTYLVTHEKTSSLTGSPASILCLDSLPL